MSFYRKKKGKRMVWYPIRYHLLSFPIGDFPSKHNYDFSLSGCRTGRISMKALELPLPKIEHLPMSDIHLSSCKKFEIQCDIANSMGVPPAFLTGERDFDFAQFVATGYITGSSLVHYLETSQYATLYKVLSGASGVEWEAKTSFEIDLLLTHQIGMMLRIGNLAERYRLLNPCNVGVTLYDPDKRSRLLEALAFLYPNDIVKRTPSYVRFEHFYVRHSTHVVTLRGHTNALAASYTTEGGRGSIAYATLERSLITARGRKNTEDKLIDGLLITLGDKQ